MMPNVFGTNHGSGSQNIATGSGDQNSNIGSGTMFVNNFYAELINNPQAAKAKMLYDEKEACLRSLGFQRMDERYQMIDDVFPDTCDWVFQTTEFQQWWHRTDMKTHNGVLWIKGKPGAGKSTLMKHILQWCEINPPSTSAHWIIRYFFNARGIPEERSYIGMLRSITYQLITGDGDMYDQFVPIFRQHNTYDQGVWTMPPLKSFIISIMKQKSNRPILMLVDALDECSQDEAAEVIGFLEKLSDSAVGSDFNLRICLSSRHYPAITIRKKIELVVEHQKEHHDDISQYIREKLHFQDDGIHEQLRWKADGIFLWVVIVIQILNQKHVDGYVEEMQNALEEVPGGLEEVFKKLLTDDDTGKLEALLMLQWMLFSLRVMTPEELFYATQAGISHGCSSSGLTRDDIKRRINTASKGLIEVRGRYKLRHSYVTFIHLSVKDFLSRNQRLQSLDPALNPDPIRLSHRRLWKICWSCIEEFHSRYPDFEDGYSSGNKVDVELEFPFIRYARGHILRHAECGISQDSKALRSGKGQGCISGEETMDEDDLEQWLKDYKNWCRIWNNVVQSIPEYDKKYVYQGIIHALSATGCPRLLRIILCEEGVDPNEQSGEFGNGLQAAAAVLRGNEAVEVVQVLLDAGADVNAKGGKDGNALIVASAQGNAGIVKMLLDAGADINAKGGKDGSALIHASGQGNADIVKILLDAGADVNLKVAICGNALMHASAQGNADIVKMLLDAGADVNAKGGKDGNADIVKIWLDAGADLNLKVAICGNALMHASAQGNADIVKMLLDAGADINAKGGKDGNALIFASAQGNADIVKMLLDAGAIINSKGEGGNCSNALIAASLDGHADIVKMLLDAGAIVNSKGEGGNCRNALIAASLDGHADIVKMLLEAGADVKAQGGIYGSALQVAAYQGSMQIVQLLLQEGADINAQCGTYGSALQAAASNGNNREIVQLLLQEGADANAKGGMYGSPLHAACYGYILTGDAHVVSQLVSAGADQRGEFGSALRAAKTRRDDIREFNGDKDVAWADELIRFLVKEGAIEDRYELPDSD